MTFIPADPVASGMPYPVAEVADHAPGSLDDFVGQTAFTVRTASGVGRICGFGTIAGDGVRFAEKDVEHSTKDVRVWLIRRDADGFVAEHAAVF